MSIDIEATTATAPAYWASYLVNGDASGMNGADEGLARAWETKLSRDGWRVVDATGEPYFAHTCDAVRNFNGDIVEYALLREVKS